MKRTIIIACCVIAGSATQALGQIVGSPTDSSGQTWFGPGPVVEMSLGGNQYLFHGNHNSSPVVLTNAMGVFVEQVRYGDFGTPELLNAQGDPIPQGQEAGNPYLFRGMRYGQEIRMYFDGLTGRTYAPETGRYLNRAAGLVATQANYTYFRRGTAAGNPRTANAHASVNPWSAGGTASFSGMPQSSLWNVPQAIINGFVFNNGSESTVGQVRGARPGALGLCTVWTIATDTQGGQVGIAVDTKGGQVFLRGGALSFHHWLELPSLQGRGFTISVSNSETGSGLQRRIPAGRPGLFQAADGDTNGDRMGFEAEDAANAWLALLVSTVNFGPWTEFTGDYARRPLAGLTRGAAMGQARPLGESIDDKTWLKPLLSVAPEDLDWNGLNRVTAPTTGLSVDHIDGPAGELPHWNWQGDDWLAPFLSRHLNLGSWKYYADAATFH
jgi:hypothetical protein